MAYPCLLGLCNFDTDMVQGYSLCFEKLNDQTIVIHRLCFTSFEKWCVFTAMSYVRLGIHFLGFIGLLFDLNSCCIKTRTS